MCTPLAEAARYWHVVRDIGLHFEIAQSNPVNEARPRLLHGLLKRAKLWHQTCINTLTHEAECGIYISFAESGGATGTK